MPKRRLALFVLFLCTQTSAVHANTAQSGSVRTGCKADADCQKAQVCELSRCRPWACGQNSECGQGGRCEDHACVAGNPTAAVIESKPQKITKRETIPALWGTGLGVTLLGYLISVGTTGPIAGSALGVIPIAGAMVVAKDNNDYPFALGLILTIAQVGGLYTVFLGSLIRREVEVEAPKSAFFIVPTAGGDTMGAVVGGIF